MLNFRKMELADMEAVYGDPALRDLITVSPRGDKFAVVIENGGEITGGATGYVEGSCAVIQATALHPVDEAQVYKDGLIRSLIHILELEGVQFLLTAEADSLYKTIGFQKFARENAEQMQLGPLAAQDTGGGSWRWINLPAFFQQQGHHPHDNAGQALT